MNQPFRITLAAALFTVAQTAFAHDPAEHAKEAAAAKAGPDSEMRRDSSTASGSITIRSLTPPEPEEGLES